MEMEEMEMAQPTTLQKVNRAIATLLIILLCIIFYKDCSRPQNNVIVNDTIIRRDTIRDTIWSTNVLHYNHVLYDTIELEKIPVITDSLSIIKDYYRTHVYHRQWNDSNLSIMLIDSIQQNKSIGSEFQYSIYDKDTLISTNVIIKKKRWGIGISAGYGICTGGLSPYVGIGINYSLFCW